MLFIAMVSEFVLEKMVYNSEWDHITSVSETLLEGTHPLPEHFPLYSLFQVTLCPISFFKMNFIQPTMFPVM